MNWLRRWWAWWREVGPERLIVILLEGPQLPLVDRYLDEGLLPHLALLCDIGQRIDVEDGRSFEPLAILELLRSRQIQTRFLSPPQLGAGADLAAICSADHAQQERLMATLRGRRCPAIVAEFSMLAQLESLFGPSPDADQRLILRDVYARMDEVVGKVFSFVDTQTVLLIAICPRRTVRGVALPVSICVSRAVGEVATGKDIIAEIVSRLLDGSPHCA